MEWLAGALVLAAVTASVGAALAGTQIPHLAAQQMANPSANFFGQLLRQAILLTAVFVLPTASCLGAAFPLALALVRDSARPAGRFANVYAINTIGSVSGSLAAGFLLIPWLGLQSTLRFVCVCLVGAVALVVLWGRVPKRVCKAVVAAAAASLAILAFSPAWDRDLLASGAYLYAAFVPKDLDLDTLLKAGQLLYYRDGAVGDGLGQAAHRHDDAGGGRKDRRVESRRHADAEARRASAAAACTTTRATSRSSASAAA